MRQEYEILDFILFYLYNDCLPNKLEKSSNHFIQKQKFDELIKFVQQYPELNRFTILLKTYMSNNNFKKGNINFFFVFVANYLGFDILINDIKKCSESLNAKIKYDESIHYSNYLFSDPAKFVQTLKFCLKQITLGLLF